MAQETTEQQGRQTFNFSDESTRYVREKVTGCCNVDLEDRDPSRINQYVQVGFQEVIAEPEGAHSSGCVFSAAYCCFLCSSKVLYNIFTFFCGLPLAFCWGCQFACVTMSHIWCITPCLRCLDIECGTCQRFAHLAIQCCLAPFCETIGLVCSKIKITHVNADTNC